MEAIELKAEPRTVVKRRLHNLRQEGYVPAVMYGRKVESQPLQVNHKSLDKVLAVAGTHQLISLQIGDQKPRMTLARDIQRDVIKRNYLHVDFYAVRMDEKVAAQIPLITTGVSPAVQDLGGVLIQALDQLEIECLPGDLISSIDINIDGLEEFHSSISVADLELPDTITIMADPSSTIVRVEPPRTAEIEEDEVEEDEELAEGVEPEVIGEDKEDE